jgi:phosphate-selective porin OprO and OprP
MMKPGFVSLTAMAFAAPVNAQTDAERIRELEARVSAQEALIQSLAGRLDALTRPVVSAGASAETASTVAQARTASAAPQPQGVSRLPEITTSDGVTIKPRGRLQAEALLVNSGDGATPTGTQLRRIQIGAEGKIGGGFRYSAEVSYAGSRLGLEDVLIAYQAGPSNEILVGYFKPPATSDDMTSDNYTLFLERSAYANLFAPGRRIGIGFNHFGRNWGLRATLSGERDDATLDVNRQEGMVVSGRAHVNLLGGGNVLHLAGSSYYTRSSSTDRAFAFSQKPEANRAIATINTGTFAARSGLFFGGEAAFEHGPLLVQAEGGTLGFDGSASGINPRFWGWAAQASWRITGETRVYDPKSGVFGRVIPSHPVGSGGTGAIEFGARFGQVDLTDGLIVGGRMTTLGAVINWYPVTHARFSTNVIRATTQSPGVADRDQTLVAVRAAVDW